MKHEFKLELLKAFDANSIVQEALDETNKELKMVN